MGLPRAIIVDLDGTLYDSKERQARCFPDGGKKDFARWNQEAELDFPHQWCAELVQAMRGTGVWPIFVSGRDGAFEVATRKWLKRYLNLADSDYLLFMRPSDDYRKDTDLKRQIYEECIRAHWDVRFCVDDRKQVVETWREMGLVCLHCAEGEF